MGRIQSSVGLATGIDIEKTVNQLVELAARPKQRLESRLETLTKQRQVVTELTTLVVGVQLTSKRLASRDLFSSVSVTSSDPAALKATKTGDGARPGTFQVDVLQSAQSFRAASQAFASRTEDLGLAGQLVFGNAATIDQSRSLDGLNAGRGVRRGEVRIVDRNGQAYRVDLTKAATVDDVVNAISEQTDGRVLASIDGDSLQLRDQTGGTGNLRVEEVAGGRAAESLGISGINVASSTATGRDLVQLGDSIPLSKLLDGRGLSTQTGDDLAITLRDGTTLDIDLGNYAKPASNATGSIISSDPNGSIQFRATATGGADDGIRIRFVDDATITTGSETVELIENASGRELVFRIDAGNTTASNIQSALSSNASLSSRFTATASGTGVGTVSVAASTQLNGGAARPNSSNPTLGDLLGALNRVSPAKFQARRTVDGNGIELLDLTTGSGTFTIADIGTGTVAKTLGIDGAAAAGTKTSKRLESGLKSVLLDSLQGGSGLGTLGNLQLRTADGATATVNLSGATTLADVVGSINASGLNIEATYNDRGDGIALIDRSAGTATTLRVSSSDGTADKLGIAADTTSNAVSGKSLARQSVSRSTLLSELNQGRGVATGSFKITDSVGATRTITIGTNAKTVGDVIDTINASVIGGSATTVGVRAQLSESGDGITLVDTAGGSGPLNVADTNGGRIASDLRLSGTGSSTLIGGVTRQAIDGRQVERIAITADQSLDEIATAINKQSRSAVASVARDPLSGGNQLVITSRRGGEAGNLQIDDNGLGLAFSTLARGQDATIRVGGDSGQPTFYRSSDGVFENAIVGVSLTASQVTDQPIQVTIGNDFDTPEKTVSSLVDQYNKLVDKMASSTSYNADTQVSGVLFGSGDIVRIQSSFSRVLTGRIVGAGQLKSLESVGISVSDTGKLELDTSKLRAQLETNPSAVADLFATEKTGIAARLDIIAESAAGTEGGLLLSRNTTLNNQIDQTDRRIADQELRLERERERLNKQFYAMEAAISKLQSSQQYINQIKPVTA
jgi:flagellar hook-associated protein 2